MERNTLTKRRAVMLRKLIRDYTELAALLIIMIILFGGLATSIARLAAPY